MFNEKLLSSEIINELDKLINSINNSTLNNRILFIGEEGTGKTESIDIISYKLNKEAYFINSSLFNIKKIIKEINHNKDKIIIFDDIEHVLLKKSVVKKRLVKKFTKMLSLLREDSIFIAITNVHKSFNIEFMNMFNHIINFDNYSIDFLLKIANDIIEKEGIVSCNKQLLNKILTMFFPLPTPIELNQLLVKSIETSDKEKQFDYLRQLYLYVRQSEGKEEIIYLYQNWFDIDEIEILTGVNKDEIKDIIKG